MRVSIKDPNSLKKKGIEVLNRELGPIGMACFMRQFSTGEGDYTKEREKLQEQISVEDIVKEIKAKK